MVVRHTVSKTSDGDVCIYYYNPAATSPLVRGKIVGKIRRETVGVGVCPTTTSVSLPVPAILSSVIFYFMSRCKFLLLRLVYSTFF